MNIDKNISEYIFRGYDIRGIYNKDLDLDVAFTIGKSYGTLLRKKFSKDKVIVGFDNRESSIMLANALMQGIIDTGVSVIFLGMVTTPMLYFASVKYNIPSAIMVTASHNPPEYNGFKMSFDEKGEICGDEIQEFRKFTEKCDFIGLLSKDLGTIQKVDIINPYIDMLTSKFDFGKRKKVVIDCGNGTASLFVKDIFGKLKVKPIYICCDSIPTYPNHQPDPAEAKNMVMLQQAVVKYKADIGIAVDGDADRVGIVDEKGNILASDYYMAIISKDILQNLPVKKIIFDVNCSKTLVEEVKKAGGTPIYYKTGNSYIKREMLKQGILFGGEISGHTFFKDKYYGFDDGLYAGLRMLELIINHKTKLSEEIDSLVKYYSTPVIKVDVEDSKKAEIVEKVKKYCIDKKYNTVTIDGARVEFDDGFAIVRMSNTTPKLTLRFEATTTKRLDQIKSEFIDLVNKFIAEA